MKDITNHIKKAADHVMLSENEKRDMSYVMREYMAHKPLPQGEFSSVSIRWFSFSWIQQPLAAALALVFIFTSGVSYAAESALPGDALYSVKTKVNESVKVALATDTEAKANVQMELAERRIEEAAALAAENRLDVDTQNSLALAFQAHAESATQEVATINEDDSSAAAEITSRFETRLAAHEAVLSIVSINADATNTLATAIRGAGLAVADIRARAEERMSVSAPVAIATMSLAMDASPASDTMTMKASAPEARTMQAEVATNVATSNESEPKYDTRAAERMRTSAEAQLKVAKKNLKSAKVKGETKATAEAELALAEDRIEEGRVFLKDKAAAQAYHSFQGALVISEKMSVMLKAGSSIKKANARSSADSNTVQNQRINARTKQNSTQEAVRIEAAAEANVQPVQIQIDTGADAVVHEVIPVIPPTLQIFNLNNGTKEDEKGDLINIGL